MIRNSNGFTEYQIIDMYCTVVGMDNTPNYKLATHIVCPLLVMVTFWVMETFVAFTRREDWAEPLQVYCPPCEVCRGENVMVWIVDWPVFVVVSRILPSVEVTGWPLESIHWAVDELVIPLRILVMLHLREYCCPAIGIPSTLMLGIINSGTKGMVYQLSVKSYVCLYTCG